MSQTSPRLIGRLVALFLLLLILAGIFAQGFVANRLILRAMPPRQPETSWLTRAFTG
jgi:hypothetical protein